MVRAALLIREAYYDLTLMLALCLVISACASWSAFSWTLASYPASTSACASSCCSTSRTPSLTTCSALPHPPFVGAAASVMWLSLNVARSCGDTVLPGALTCKVLSV